jgi:hypothetical protein
MNEKAYQRWQHVLQEGLVPMAVRGLGLLEIIDGATKCHLNDEEEEYFLSLQGMDEEIQMMAILGRAASLRDHNADNEPPTSSAIGDEMEPINSVMQSTAMLMFHVVMMASTPTSTSNPNESSAKSPKGDPNERKAAAGYDGRVRHVLKVSCVDMLTSAILKSIETYEEKKSNEESFSETDTQNETDSKLYDVDEYTLWNIPNIKTFVDEHSIGKEAIFGTIWHKKTSDMLGLLGKKQGSKQELQPSSSPQKNAEQTAAEVELQTEPEEFPSIEEMHSDSLLTDETDEEESTADKKVSVLEDDAATEQHEELLDETNTEEQENAQNQSSQQSCADSAEQQKPSACENDTKDEQEELDNILQQDEEEARLAKRQLNAKFLASRKFELIERTVAIDVVRFLMAEERERKLREQEQKEQNNKFMNVVEMLKKATEDESNIGAECSGNTENSDKQSDENESNHSGTDAPSETSSEYWTSHRKKQVLRSLKIAGVGLT